MAVVKNELAERELVFSRLLNAPISLVWELFVDPEHIKNWWGPDGFTNTIRKMEVKPGGRWELTMRGPDGTDYQAQCIFREVIRHKRIVYEQLENWRCISTIEFESRGKQTFLRWQLLFESREYMIKAAKAHGVDIGLTQTAERLIAYLAKEGERREAER
jgi:uncharacterized protein YndB with AHSA1/START domain